MTSLSPQDTSPPTPGTSLPPPKCPAHRRRRRGTSSPPMPHHKKSVKGLCINTRNTFQSDCEHHIENVSSDADALLTHSAAPRRSREPTPGVARTPTPTLTAAPTPKISPKHQHCGGDDERRGGRGRERGGEKRGGAGRPAAVAGADSEQIEKSRDPASDGGAVCPPTRRRLRSRQQQHEWVLMDLRSTACAGFDCSFHRRRIKRKRRVAAMGAVWPPMVT